LRLFLKRAVVDQPGFKVIVLGLVLSVILGLSIKSQISPRKIKARLDKAISRLQPDLKIDFNSVQIKLSDWGWPQPYLEVHDIRVSPVKAICEESQIFVETLSFPLSWNLLFDTKKVIKSLRISQLEVRLSELKNCFMTSVAESDSESVLQRHLIQVFTAPNAEQLQELKIDRIKILSKDNYQMPLYLQAAVLDFTYANQMLSKIALKAQTVFYNDNEKQLFKIKSDLNLSFEKQNADEVRIQGQLNGKLIDRDYKVQFNYQPDINSIYIIFAAQKISVKSLYKVFHWDQYFNDLLKTELQSYFMTLQGTSFYNLNKNKFDKIQFSEFKMESESSSVVSTELEINALKPLDIRNSLFQVKNIDMTVFLNTLLIDQNIKDRIVTAGQLSGEMQVVSLNQVKITGQVQGLNLRISSLKENLQQSFDKLNLDFSFKEKSKTLILDHFEMNQKNVKGFLKYQSLENQSPQISFEVSGDFLSTETISELWGSDDPLNLTFKGKIEKGHVQYDFMTKKMNFNGFKAADVIYVYKSQDANQSPRVSFKATNVAWDDVNEADRSDFMKFYVESVNLKKIEAEGTYSEPLYQISIPVKGNKLKLSLDFLNNKFQVDE
jgi:hypothetical protein